MIGHATAHRRANAFARALETGQTGEADSGARLGEGAQGELLTLANALADLPRPTLDPEVKTVQRARLIAAMESALADGSLEASGRVPEQRDGAGPAGRRRPALPRTRWSRRLAVGGLTVGVAAGAFSGVAAASSDALPGDTLYGLKRGMEDLQLGMANSDADKGRVLLDMATTRLQEARRLLERSRSGPLDSGSVSEVRRALSGMHSEAAEGHRLLSGAYQRDGSLSPIETLSSFSQSNRSAWQQVRRQLPPQLSEVGNQVTQVFDAIDHEVAPLQGLLPPSAPKGSGVSGGGTGTARRSRGRHAAPPAGAASRDHSGTQSSGSPSPSASDGSGDLLGGTGLLTPPSASTGPSSGTSTTQPEVTVPPLLPGLLPGLGIGVDDTTTN